MRDCKWMKAARRSASAAKKKHGFRRLSAALAQDLGTGIFSTSIAGRQALLSTIVIGDHLAELSLSISYG